MNVFNHDKYKKAESGAVIEGSFIVTLNTTIPSSREWAEHMLLHEDQDLSDLMHSFDKAFKGFVYHQKNQSKELHQFSNVNLVIVKVLFFIELDIRQSDDVPNSNRWEH